MRELYVNLPNVQRVQKFVSTLTKLNGDFELVSGGHVLDARSLMGIFTLDLTHPVLLRVYDENQPYMDALRPFLADGEEETR